MPPLPPRDHMHVPSASYVTAANTRKNKQTKSWQIRFPHTFVMHVGYRRDQSVMRVASFRALTQAQGMTSALPAE